METAGPEGTLPIPDGAVMWDAVQDVWAPVASGSAAKSKVTFDYTQFLQSFWQHGPPITMADVIYPIAQGYEIAFDEAKVQIETALGITSRPLYETFKGYVIGESTIEVYVDYWHFEEGYIASYASPSGVSTPWEILAAMDDVVFEKRRGAYSDTTAARFYRTLDQPGDRERCPPGAAIDPGVQSGGKRSGRSFRHRWCIAGNRRGSNRALRGLRRLVRRDESPRAGQWTLSADGLRSTCAVRSAGCIPAGRLSVHRRGLPVWHTAHAGDRAGVAARLSCLARIFPCQ